MATELESLQISINAKSTKANDAIDRLVGKLDRLSISLGKINGSSISGLANGVDKLGRAMQTMNSVSTADFTRLATNLEKMGKINVASLNSAASSMSHLSRALSTLSGVSANSTQIVDVANSIGKLGGVSVQRAITNMPQLALAMNNLMTTLSRSPQVSRNLIDMTNALANLASQGQRISTATNSMVNGLGNTDRAVRRTSKSTLSLAATFGKFYASYFLVIRGMKSLWKSIESTADYFEAFNYFNVAMTKIGSDWSSQFADYGYDNAEAYAKSFNTRLTEKLSQLSGVKINAESGTLEATATKNLGLNIREITQYASQLAPVTNSVGQTGEVSLATASAFTKLGADMSSLFNMDYSQVMNNLQSGLIGQSRALYRYGIDITNATLQTLAYELGVEKAVSEMTQAEKMQLRLIAILDQSRVSWGDQANTINSTSNQIRLLKNNLSETGMILGQLFIPILNNLLPALNGLSIAFKRLLTDIAGFMGISIDLDSFGQGYSGIEDDINAEADAYDNATESAKKYRNQILSFDDVAKLQDTDSDSSGSGASGSVNLENEILKATEEYEKAWQEAYDKMENRAEEFADKFYSFFEIISEKATPLKNIFIDFYNDFVKPLGKWSVGKGFPKLLEHLNDFSNDIKWGKLRENLDSFWVGIEPFAKGFGEGFLSFFDVLTEIGAVAINSIGDAIGLFGEMLKKLGVKNVENLGKAFAILKTSLIALNGTDKILTLLMGAISKHPYVSLAVGITYFASAFSNLVNGITIGRKSDVWNVLPKQIDDLLISSKEFKEGYENLSATNLESISSILSKYERIREMAEKYLEMSSNYNTLSDEQKQLVKTYADSLSSNVDGINENIDSITGKWKGTTDELQKAIDKQEEFSLNSAKEEILSELYKELVEGKKQYDESFSELQSSLEQIYEFSSLTDDKRARTAISYLEDVNFEAKKLDAQKRSFVHTLRTENEMFDDYLDKVEATRSATDSYSDSIGNIQDDIAYYNELTLDSIKNNTDWKSKSSENFNHMKNETSNAVKKIITDIGSIYPNMERVNNGIGRSFSASTEIIKKNSLDAVNSVNNNLLLIKKPTLRIDTFPFVDYTNNALVSANNILNGLNTPSLEINTSDALNGVNGFVSEANKKLKNIQLNFQTLYEEKFSSPAKTLTSLIIQPKLPGYEFGGFPNVSKPFVVGENGPELYGGMFGRPAVANSDSITSGIEEAAYRGMIRALAESGSGNTSVNVTLEGDARNLFKAVQKEANNYTRSTGEMAFLY